ncbi:hypothetical protein [Zavarzinia sp. CC-PAN008]|uniref:hypothetical protein n=1 Tax=Zavarzinia sp. CC-PAN008 TaxID=3243332 RepID=UPI003F74AA6A
MRRTTLLLVALLAAALAFLAVLVAGNGPDWAKRRLIRAFVGVPVRVVGEAPMLQPGKAPWAQGLAVQVATSSATYGATIGDWIQVQFNPTAQDFVLLVSTSGIRTWQFHEAPPELKAVVIEAADPVTRVADLPAHVPLYHVPVERKLWARDVGEIRRFAQDRLGAAPSAYARGSHVESLTVPGVPAADLTGAPRQDRSEDGQYRSNFFLLQAAASGYLDERKAAIRAKVAGRPVLDPLALPPPPYEIDLVAVDGSIRDPHFATRAQLASQAAGTQFDDLQARVAENERLARRPIPVTPGPGRRLLVLLTWRDAHWVLEPTPDTELVGVWLLYGLAAEIDSLPPQVPVRPTGFQRDDDIATWFKVRDAAVRGEGPLTLAALADWLCQANPRGRVLLRQFGLVERVDLRGTDGAEVRSCP